MKLLKFPKNKNFPKKIIFFKLVSLESPFYRVPWDLRIFLTLWWLHRLLMYPILQCFNCQWYEIDVFFCALFGLCDLLIFSFWWSGFICGFGVALTRQLNRMLQFFQASIYGLRCLQASQRPNTTNECFNVAGSKEMNWFQFIFNYIIMNLHFLHS